MFSSPWASFQCLKLGSRTLGTQHLGQLNEQSCFISSRSLVVDVAGASLEVSFLVVVPSWPLGCRHPDCLLA